MTIDINDKSFFYQEAANDIVNSILMLMNDGIKDYESYSLWNYNIPISDVEESIHISTGIFQSQEWIKQNFRGSENMIYLVALGETILMNLQLM